MHFVENWKNITSDPNILDIVLHCHIEFEENTNPENSSVPHCYLNQNKKK